MEGVKQQQHQRAQDQQVWQPQNDQKFFSNHLLQYLDYFGYSDLQEFQQKRADLFSSIQNSPFFEVTQDFQPTLSIKLLAHSPNYEFIELQVAFGNFIFKNLTIANFNVESYTHIASHSFSGTFCMTYRVSIFGQDLAFKCFHFPIQNEDSDKLKILTDRINIIREAIREYCLSLVASELQFGPRIQKILGFDIAVYNNCVEFPMECCAHKKLFPVKLDYESQLKKAISSAHLCKLIHYDIKPVNICYSLKRKKLVFIDYGFSEFSRVELGELLKIKYRGSYSYVTKEMADIFLTKDYGLVDPYYNDIHCIEKCVGQYQPNQEQNLTSYHLTKYYLGIENLSFKYIVKKFKCLLYKGTNQDLQKILKIKRYERTILQFKREILNFDYELRYPALFPQIIKILNTDEEYEEKIVKTHNIFCPQPFQLSQQSSQNAAYDFYQKWFNFLQKYVLCFENNCKPWQYSYSNQTESIINTTQLHPAFRQSYFVVLAEALQINTSKYTLQQRIKMATAGHELLAKYQPKCCKENRWAFNQQKKESKLRQLQTEETLNQVKSDEKLNEVKSEEKLNQVKREEKLNQAKMEEKLKQANMEETLNQVKTEEQLIKQKPYNKLSQLKRVSVELLQYSLSPPHKKYKLKIYEAILINLIVLKAVSHQELFIYYQRVHSLDINAETKLRMVLKFATSYQWMSFTIKSQQNYFKHIKKYRDLTLQYIEQLKKSHSKAQIIYFYKLLAQFYDHQIVIIKLQKRQNLKIHYQSNLRNISNKKLKQIISDWKTFIHNYFTNMTNKDFAICQRQLFHKNHSIYLKIEYYHFGFFRNYLNNLQTNKMKSIRNLFLRIFTQLQKPNEYVIQSIPQILGKFYQLNKNMLQSKTSPLQQSNKLERSEKQLEEMKQYIKDRLPQSLFQYQALFSNILEKSYNNMINNHQMIQFYLNLSLLNKFQAQLTNQETFMANKLFSSVNFYQNIALMQSCDYQLAQKKYFNNCMVQKLKIRYKQQMEVFKKIKGKLNNYQQIIYLNICFQQLGLILSLKNHKKNDWLHKIFIRVSYILRNSLFSPCHVAMNLNFAQNIMVSKEKQSQFHESIRILYNFYYQYPSQKILFYGPAAFSRIFLMVLHDHGVQKAFDFYKIQFEHALRVIKSQYCFQYFRFLTQVISQNLSLKGEVQKQKLVKMMQNQLEKHTCLAIISIPVLQTSHLKHRRLLLKLFKSLKHLYTPFRSLVKYFLFLKQIDRYVRQPVFLRKLMSMKRKYIKIYHDGHIKRYEKSCKLKEWIWSPVLRSKKDSCNQKHISLFRQKISKIKIYEAQILFNIRNRVRLDYR